MNQTKFKVSILIAVFCCSLQIEVSARSVFCSGVDHYNRGEYGHAVIFFNEAVADEPNSPLAHYYLANALVHLGQVDRSLAEYDLGYRLNPNGQIGRYCQQALQSFRKLSPAVTVATASGAAPLNFKHPDPLPIIRGNILATESVIRRQAKYEKEKHRMVGESWAAGLLNQAEGEARRIQEEAAQEIERALTPGPIFVGPGRMLIVDPQQARAKAEQIRRQSEEATARARMEAAQKANQYRQWSREKQYALDEVVANLESQLESPVGHSKVRLQAIGTDLYVRYYGPLRVAPTNVRPIEQAAKQQVIESEDSAVQEAMPLGRRAQRVVRGKILK